MTTSGRLCGDIIERMAEVWDIEIFYYIIDSSVIDMVCIIFILGLQWEVSPSHAVVLLRCTGGPPGGREGVAR